MATRQVVVGAQFVGGGGPPLAALRLYELEWTIDADAANVDRPDRRRFIAQVSR